MTFRLFYPLSVVMTMVARLLRKFRRSLQIKKSTANAPCVLQFAAQPKYTYQSNSEKWLVRGIPPMQLKKLLKSHRKKINNWFMVSFIHNGSEITIWMGNSFKIKNKIQSNIFKITTPFLNFKLQIIRLAQRHWSCTPSH